MCCDVVAEFFEVGHLRWGGVDSQSYSRPSPASRFLFIHDAGKQQTPAVVHAVEGKGASFWSVPFRMGQLWSMMPQRCDRSRSPLFEQQ